MYYFPFEGDTYIVDQYVACYEYLLRLMRVETIIISVYVAGFTFWKEQLTRLHVIDVIHVICIFVILAIFQFCFNSILVLIVSVSDTYEFGISIVMRHLVSAYAKNKITGHPIRSLFFLT